MRGNRKQTLRLPHLLPPLARPCARYKYQVWQDSRLGRQKMVRDGLETVLTLVPGELAEL